jgi:hypothetical protein
MIRRLICLNAVLIVFLAAICMLIWKQAHDATSAIGWLHAPLEKTQFSLSKSLISFSPLKASSYVGIAEGNLLSPDRNSNIILETPPAINLPEPLLPLLTGVVLFADLPPTVLLSMPPSSEICQCHPGDPIGEWQIDTFDRQQIVLMWKGLKVTKQIVELVEKRK